VSIYYNGSCQSCINILYNTHSAKHVDSNLQTPDLRRVIQTEYIFFRNHGILLEPNTYNSINDMSQTSYNVVDGWGTNEENSYLYENANVSSMTYLSKRISSKSGKCSSKNAPYRGNQFLNTYNDDDYLVTPTYAKGGSWLKVIGKSNSAQQDSSQTMPPSANIEPGFSPIRTPHAHETAPNSRHATTSCASAPSTTTTTAWGMSSAK